MRRITLAVMSTLSGLVMLFSYHTSLGSQAAIAGSDPQGTSTGTSSGTSTGTSSSGSTGSSSGTYTGEAVQTEWGLVQVRITVENGQITAAEAIQYPDENPKDQQINAYAVPRLNAAAVAEQSADIDAISGATVTSNGYVQSLQSAIDQASR